jgi:small subunit ribosomal protein S4
MARYTGPSCRLCRYLNEKLMLKGERCSTPKCPIEKKNMSSRGRFQSRPPKISDRGLQLREKQKLRFSYGVLERQFRRFFSEAIRTSGSTGDNLRILLERRLDNIVYRLGFADSRAQARQITNHGHILVNGRKVNIPSFLVKSGDVIAWHQSSRKTEFYKTVLEKVKAKTIPSWLSLDEEKMEGAVLTLPTKDELEAKFDTSSIVEYYSR